MRRIAGLVAIYDQDQHETINEQKKPEFENEKELELKQISVCIPILRQEGP